jgi:hypothetical protein
MVRGVFDRPLGGHRGPIGCSIIGQEFYETDLSRGFVRGYSFQVARGLSPIATATGGSIGNRVPWGREHRRAYGSRFDRTISVAVIGEDLPERHNRVDLDPALTDGHGIPAPRVSYTLSENSRRMLEHGIARAGDVLRAAGAREVDFNPLLRAGGWHLMGTARMGQDPATSVLDAAGPMPRRAQSLHRGRERGGDQRGREPHLDDPGSGPLRRRRADPEARVTGGRSPPGAIC